jgi:hypothetical protein
MPSVLRAAEIEQQIFQERPCRAALVERDQLLEDLGLAASGGRDHLAEGLGREEAIDLALVDRATQLLRGEQSDAVGDRALRPVPRDAVGAAAQ